MRAKTLFATALLATVALAGCSDSSSSDSSTAGNNAGVAEQAPAAPAPADGGTAKDQAGQAPDLSIDQRSLIYTGSITVRVEDVNAAAAQATAFATGAGGFIGGDERHSGGANSGTDNASLTLRVPAEKFTAVVEQLAGLGKEQQRGTSTEDVTEQTVDLDARIAVQQARVDSGRRLLAQAKSLSDLVMLEKEVATRESDLASLQAKKRKLADLTALSTITAVLLGPEAAAAKTDDGPPGFLAGLAGGWKALVASLAVLLTVLGALLPWLIALGIPAWAIVYLVRRFVRRRPQQPAPGFAAAGSPVGQYLQRGQHQRPQPPGAARPQPQVAPVTAPPAPPAPSSAPPASTAPPAGPPAGGPPPRPSAAPE